MRPKTQQIALDLDPDDYTTLDPPLEPERVRQLIGLMAEAMVAIVEPLGRTNDDDR